MMIAMNILRRARWIAGLASAACVILAAAPMTAAPLAPKRPLVVAHRGGAALMPENTFPAFDNAVRLGVDMIEFDMEMTSDDQLIVQHDGTVNATFCTADPGSAVTPGPVRHLTLAELERFDCGSKHRDIYPDQIAVPGARMPTLPALLDRYRRAKVTFFGEAKMPGLGEGDVNPVVFARSIAAAVRKSRLEDRFILQSADYRTIDAMHAINPRIRTCLLRPWEAKTDFLELARRHHAKCMLLRLQDADAEQVKRLRDTGVMVISEVIDRDPDWHDYLLRGDDALFTNDPKALLAYLRKKHAD